MTLRSSRAPIHRFAHLCALVAILAYQPLAAFHFATDETHLANAATSIQVAHHHGEAHRHFADGRHGHGHHGHHHADQLCDFCILAGVSLPPLPVAPAAVAAEHGPAAPAQAESVRAEKRLRVGHPARAPPLTV